MSEVAKADLIIERIRERLRARKEDVHRPQPLSPASDSSVSYLYDLTRLRHEVTQCNVKHGAVGIINPRHRGPINAIIQLLKKGLRRTLTWYTRPIQEFHESVTRALDETTAGLINLQTNLATLMQNLEALKTSQKRDFDEIHSRERDAQERIRSAERDLRKLAHLTEQRGVHPVTASTDAYTIPVAKAEYDFDYFLFEDRFRGSEQDIKDRQRTLYVDYFAGKENVLDLGCGRGEFLEILREAGISSRGVEKGLDAYLLCAEKKLEVAHQDLFDYLQSVPDESLGGIFSAQVIEHLPVESQFRMVRLAQSKLISGSPLIIETINPECVSALVRNFYLDPTHIRPVHPEMLKFVFESMSLQNVEIKFSSPLSAQQIPILDLPIPATELERVNKSLQCVNERLFGSQDYAVIGWK